MAYGLKSSSCDPLKKLNPGNGNVLTVVLMIKKKCCNLNKNLNIVDVNFSKYDNMAFIPIIWKYN